MTQRKSLLSWTDSADSADFSADSADSSAAASADSADGEVFNSSSGSACVGMCVTLVLKKILIRVPPASQLPEKAKPLGEALSIAELSY